jgi:hypothetical protein
VGFLQLLGFKKKPTPKQMREMLPATHSFVDCMVRNGPKGQVCFEFASPKTFVTTLLPGMASGQNVVLSYQNLTGKYRFQTSIVSVSAMQATLAIPTRIETVQKFSGTRLRSAVRMDTTVQCQWRYAPTGKIATEYTKGSVSDISRSGASLTCERELKIGTAVELLIPLNEKTTINVRGEARRVEHIPTSKKWTVGLRFMMLKPDDDRAILDFINRRQTDLRNRGLG